MPPAPLGAALAGAKIDGDAGSGTRLRISVPLEPASHGGGQFDLSDVA